MLERKRDRIGRGRMDEEAGKNEMYTWMAEMLKTDDDVDEYDQSRL